jgi:hypothetical protein
MENDSVRTIGDCTLVDIWISGKLRGISVSRGAIDAFRQLTPGRAAEMSDEDRRQFVTANLGIIVSAAAKKLAGANPGSETVLLEAGDIGGHPAEPVAERRTGEDRRKGGRRREDRRAE